MPDDKGDRLAGSSAAVGEVNPVVGGDQAEKYALLDEPSTPGRGCSCHPVTCIFGGGSDPFPDQAGYFTHRCRAGAVKGHGP